MSLKAIGPNVDSQDLNDNFAEGKANLDMHKAGTTQFATLTVNIPSDYPTLQEAIDELSKRNIKQGVTITLLIESGHQPSTGIVVSDGSYGHFKISSFDAEVIIGGSFAGKFIVATNAIAPTLDCFIDGNNTLDRVYSLTTSFGEVTAGNGGRNTTGRPLYANASFVNASSTVWRDFADQIYVTAGSGLQFANAIVSGATITGNGAIVASRGGRIEAQNLNISNCAIAVECKRAGSAINCHDATFDSISNIAILCQREATVACENAAFTNIDNHFIQCLNGGRVYARDVSVTASAGNTGTGVTASSTSQVSVLGANTLISGFGVDGLYAVGASQIDAEAATVENSTRNGVYSTKGSLINVNAGTSTGSGGSDLYAALGSQVSANGCTTTSSTGTPAAGDTNFTAFNTIESNKGVIWN